MVRQTDGKLVVLSELSRLSRYNADGTQDLGFGTNGVVIVTFNNASDTARGLALQSDGKIVVVGRALGGTLDDFGVARFNADGTLDTGFGTSGKLSIDINGSFDEALEVLIQPDGRIVVAGNGGTSGPLGVDADFAAVRLMSGRRPRHRLRHRRQSSHEYRGTRRHRDFRAAATRRQDHRGGTRRRRRRSAAGYRARALHLDGSTRPRGLRPHHRHRAHRPERERSRSRFAVRRRADGGRQDRARGRDDAAGRRLPARPRAPRHCTASSTTASARTASRRIPSRPAATSRARSPSRRTAASSPPARPGRPIRSRTTC